MKGLFSFLLCSCFPFAHYCQITSCFDLSYDEGKANVGTLDSLDTYGIFFLGETHNVGSNDLMDYTLLTSLNRTQQVTHFIKEGSYSYIFMLAQYIETSDPHYLELFEVPAVREERQFIDQLAAYNKSVPKSQQIKLYGIDAEPFFHLSKMLDALLYKHGDPPKVVAETFDILKTFKAEEWTFFISKKEKNEIKKIWEKVRPLISQNKKVFQEYLKDDLIHLLMVLDNPVTLKRSEGQLLDNFLKLQQLTGASGFYFSYGSLHAQKKGGWLADLINKTSLFENKVFSIESIYHNSTLLWGNESRPVNSLEESNEEEAKKVLETFDTCEYDFAFLPPTGLSYESKFDLLFLARNQQAITVESDDAGR